MVKSGKGERESRRRRERERAWRREREGREEEEGREGETLCTLLSIQFPSAISGHVPLYTCALSW